MNARVGSLVLHKGKPGRVLRLADRWEVELVDGTVVRVRPKDVDVLHPGPLSSLQDLGPIPADVEAAWEILEGSSTTLAELAELLYGAFTPHTAWATWEIVRQGEPFAGGPDRVVALGREEREARAAARREEERRHQEWDEFLCRVREHSLRPGDDRFLAEVEAMALGKCARSRLLRCLGRSESPEEAHALLLELGVWGWEVNPYPARLGVAMEPPGGSLPPLPEEPRRDLRGLRAFAIDDRPESMADDALSIADDGLWVHVADPAAVIRPGDPLDEEACGRGAALYLPECTVPMVPLSAIQVLGLGETDPSPAISFRVKPTQRGAVLQEVVPSWVSVTKTSYSQVEDLMDEEPFAQMWAMAQLYREGRLRRGAVFLDLPEVEVRVTGGEVTIQPVAVTRSRVLVQEAMVMTGEAVARWAQERGLPMPFSAQEMAGEAPQASTLSGMYATRRLLRPRQYRTTPSRHAALGLDAYVQVTSPLRRYLDLVAHQQIRAALASQVGLGGAEILRRAGSAESAMGVLRAAEQLSRRHWTLVYLSRHPGWRGRAIVVEKRGRSATVLIPSLGLEETVHLPWDVPLDEEVSVCLIGVHVPTLQVHFLVSEAQEGHKGGG